MDVEAFQLAADGPLASTEPDQAIARRRPWEASADLPMTVDEAGRACARGVPQRCHRRPSASAAEPLSVPRAAAGRLALSSQQGGSHFTPAALRR